MSQYYFKYILCATNPFLITKTMTQYFKTSYE